MPGADAGPVMQTLAGPPAHNSQGGHLAAESGHLPDSSISALSAERGYSRGKPEASASPAAVAQASTAIATGC